MDKKEEYFVPQIEDIRVGYECEVEWHVFNQGHEWRKLVVDLELLSMMKNTKSVRVPYLTKEQIEKNLEMSGINCIFEYNKNILKLYDDKNTYYFGLCKSVNELRQLLGYIKFAI